MEQKLNSNSCAGAAADSYMQPAVSPVLAVVYSDGKDYSHLKANSDQYPEHEECVYCGSTNVTITDDADICHECGEVYT